MKPTLFLLCLFFQAGLAQLHAQWSKTQSPEGGTVEGFVRIVDTIIANAGRLYYSTDAGDHWQALPADNGLRSGQLRTDGRNLLLRSYVPENSANKLFFSADRGEHWTAVPSPDSLRFSLFEISGPYIYGAHYNAIYRTADLGQHWEYWPYNGPGFIDHVFLDDSGWMVATHRYLLRASDPGQPWDTLLKVDSGLETVYVNSDTLLVIQKTSQNDWVFHRSTDGGGHWEIMGQIALPTNIDFRFLSDGGVLYAIFPNCYISSYRSLDWGQTWTPITQPVFCSDFTAGLAFGDTLLTATRRRGILKSTNGGMSWTLANKGMRALQPENIHSIEGQLYAMQTDGLYILEANAQDWSRLPISDSMISWHQYSYFQDLVKTGHGYVVLLDTRLYRLDNQLSNLDLLLGDDQMHYYAIGIFRVANVQDEIAGFGGHDQFTFCLSSEKGRYFRDMYPSEEVPGGPETMALTDSSLYLLQYGGRLFRSDDLGASWTVQSDVVPVSYFGLLGGEKILWVSGESMFLFHSFLIQQYADKMLYSPDHGATWIHYDLLAGERPWGASDFTSLLEYQGTLMATTHNGIFVSQDNGLNWTPWNEGLEWLPARSLAIHDGFVWTGIQGDGIWKRPLSDLNFVGENQIVRAKLEIWPNPASHTAQVLLPFAGELLVADPLGRVIYQKFSEQVSEFLPVSSWTPGLYQVTLRGQAGIISGSFIKK